MAPRRTGHAKPKKNGTFIIQICLDGGKRHYEVFRPKRLGDEKTAKDYAERLQRLYDEGKWKPKSVEEADVVVNPLDACGPSSTMLEFAQAWIKTEDYESAPKDAKVIDRYLARAPLGRLPVASVDPPQALEFARWLKSQPSARGGKLAPRTVRNSYDVVLRALNHAAFLSWIAVNPFKNPVARKELPPMMDKHPRARESWTFPRTDVEKLISDPRVRWDRRVLYAITFMTGCRIGEASALRLSDWDRQVQPLGRLTIAVAVKSVSRAFGPTKTRAVKPVPVHPALAMVLEDWVREGWPKMMGRPMAADDLLVPTTKGNPRHANQGNRDLTRDCATLTIPRKHQHCERHTFIRLALADGGDPLVVKHITHRSARDAFDSYAGLPWPRMCEELGKLRITYTPPPDLRWTPRGG